MTNHVEKLDPALIRRGRMDKHIELSYCCFEAFKVLARNYLDLESHDMFGTVKQLLEETKMTPTDVANDLLPKSGGEDEEACLKRLAKALEDAKEEARLTVEEEEKQKKLAEEEEEKKKEAAEEEEKKNADEKSAKEGDKEKEANKDVAAC